MRVLHVDLGRELRGGQLQALLLLTNLQRAGHTCTLLARRGLPLYRRAQNDGVAVVPASLFQLFRLSGDCDIVHAHDAHAHTWAALASRKPFVVSRRVGFPIKDNALSRLKYSRAARYLAVSEFVARRLASAGVPQTRIDVVHDAVVSYAANSEWARDAPVVALASKDPLKGRALIKEAGEIARIPIKFSDDLATDLSHASAFVYVSKSEGFGSAALLAMSKGVPLIASSVEGLAEVFENKISGLSVANHATSVAAALERLFLNPELAQTLITNAHFRVQNLFNPTVLLNNTLASYQRALRAS